MRASGASRSPNRTSPRSSGPLRARRLSALEPQAPVVERARELLERAGFSPLQIEPAGDGSQHHLLVVEVDDGPLRLLRMARAEFAQRLQPKLRAEAEAVLRARGEVPVPHPLELIPDPHAAEASLQPILPGRRASELRTDAGVNADLTRICIELGRTLAQLHRVRRVKEDPTVIRTVLPEFADDELCLLHGDAHLGNLLVEPHRERGWTITGVIDWSFCAWGPPEADLVEMAICEAEPRPHLGRVFYEAYVRAGGLPPREEVFRAALIRELKRRLEEHRQGRDLQTRDRWTRWIDALGRPDAVSTRIFDIGRGAGRGLA